MAPHNHAEARKAVVSINEACSITRLSRHTLMQLAQSGQITSFPLPSRRTLLLRADVDKLSAQQPNSGESE